MPTFALRNLSTQIIVGTAKLKQNLTDPIRSRSREKQYLDTVLEAVKFPARIADLDTGLTDVDRNALPHFRIDISTKKKQKRNLRGFEEGES